MIADRLQVQCITRYFDALEPSRADNRILPNQPSPRARYSQTWLSNMSKTTKGKHVKKEVIDDYYEPEGDEQIVRVVAGRGNNLHEVEGPDQQRYLVSMPTKFRKNVWIKRGDFVIVEPIKEGDKVQAEIVCILYPKQIKYLKHEKLWPEEFSSKQGGSSHASTQQGTAAHASTDEATLFPPLIYPDTSDDKEEGTTGESSSEDDDDDLFQNPNHRPVVYYSEDDTSSDDEERGEGEGEGEGDEEENEKENAEPGKDDEMEGDEIDDQHSEIKQADEEPAPLDAREDNNNQTTLPPMHSLQMSP